MLINATIRSDKSKILQNEYIRLINSGILPEKILVLCLNSYKKQQFLKAIEEEITIPVYGKYNIQTFFGLCYNAINDNWALIQNGINFGTASVTPNLCGLELSRMFLYDSIKDGLFEDYFSKNNLIHQIFKRMQLIVLNNLSDSEIKQKSQILKESFDNDCSNVYDNFRKLTLKYKSFDYLRQISILPYILKNTNYFRNIEYLFIDDADEITFAEYNFIEKIKPQLKNWYIAYDENGASRCGYLCAYKTGISKFEKLFGEKPIKIKKNDVWEINSQKIFLNIINNKKTDINNFLIQSFIKRLDMIDKSFEQIKKLIKDGVKPSDIVIITPLADDMLKISFERFFGLGVKYQILSGSKKPNESSLLRNIFCLLKLVHKSWGLKIDEFEYLELFVNCLKIPLNLSREFVKTCLDTIEINEIANQNINFQVYCEKLINFINNFSNKNIKFSEEIIEIYQHFFQYDSDEKELKIFNFFLKEIRSFEKAFGVLNEELKKRIILQFQNGIISENPSIAEEIEKDAIIISTPQKVIDYEIKRKYHFWLDISNNQWSMQDIGVLYNAWVFNADWHNKEFTIEDNTRLSQEKNARIIRKLFLCCDEKIYAYFSQYDSLGYENIGVLQSYFISTEQKDSKKQSKQIVPRDDQIQVINYKGGYAAVNAVPGAVKTTVLTALLIKLIKNGVSPSNIYVLTYMESAATNIREKIKNAIPNLTEYPNISTIHGLAYRIIKENNNYTKLNLSDTIEVLDDNARQKFLRECISALNLNHDDYDDYQAGISAIKLSPDGIKSLKYLKNSIQFEKVYKLYEKTLRKNAVIDYDDMLRYAVQLIENFPEIRQYYAESCNFIFEDEAQDSSEIQQKLLIYLSEKHHNLLRIGDINQAITSSFTDSNPKCFKKYFQENYQMVMKSSQRSSVQIQELANKLIDYSKSNNYLRETFFDSKLSPTKNNPKVKHSPEFFIYKESDEEKYGIITKIKEKINTIDKNSTIAILLRSNYQVIEWAGFFAKNGLSVVLRTDLLEQKTIFKVIYAYLNFLQTPFSNSIVLNLMNILDECKIISFSNSDKNYIKNLQTPFILTNGDEISESLTHLWWDIQFNEDLIYAPLDEAVIRIGLRYFSTQNEKSNVYLIATIIKRLQTLYSNRKTVIEKLEQISKRPIGSSFKFFEDENDIQTGAIRLMTMHKSKGDEFDIVFIPQLSEENYPLLPEKIKIKSNFSEKIKQLRKGYKPKTTETIKKEISEETLRLLYVGITRAKRELYISCSLKNNFKRKQNPSEIFEKIAGVGI